MTGRAVQWVGVLAGMVLASGCPASSNIYGSQGTHSAGTAGTHTAASGAGSTAAAIGTGTGGSTSAGSGGSLGGSTGGGMDAGCNGILDPSVAPLTDCASPETELLVGAYEDCNINETLRASGFEVVDLDDPSKAGATDACGRVHFCLDAGAVVSLQFEKDGYDPAILAPMQIGHSIGVGYFYFICESLLSTFALAAAVPNPSGSLVAVLVMPVDEDYTAVSDDLPDAGCFDLAGWSFTLVAPDGGVVSDTGYYVDGLGSETGTNATGSYGFVVFFSVAPGLGYVTVVGSRPGNDLPDGGVRCANVSSALEFTGQITVQPSALTIYPYAVRPTDPGVFASPGQACDESSSAATCIGLYGLTCDQDVCCGVGPYPCTSDDTCCGHDCRLPDGGLGPPTGDSGVCGP